MLQILNMYYVKYVYKTIIEKIDLKNGELDFDYLKQIWQVLINILLKSVLLPFIDFYYFSALLGTYLVFCL